MAQLLSVPVYQIGSQNKLSSPNATYIGIAFAQMASVWPLSGAPRTVNGAYVYSVINTTGTPQFPGNSYYTSLTAAAIIAAS